MDFKILWKKWLKNIKMMMNISQDLFSIYLIIQIGFIIKKEGKENKSIFNYKNIIIIDNIILLS